MGGGGVNPQINGGCWKLGGLGEMVKNSGCKELKKRKSKEKNVMIE